MVARWMLGLAALLALAVPAAAQEPPPDPGETARIKIGPLALTPSFAIRDFGIDTNVFNTTTNPKQDLTGTVSGLSSFWLRAGPVRFTSDGHLDYVYFDRYKQQGGLNGGASVKLSVPVVRITPFVEIAYQNARDRVGYDVDIRARHSDAALGGGIDVALSTKTTLKLSARRARTNFTSTDAFLGSSLQDAFDRTSDLARAGVRYRLTPLTTIGLDVEAERERFRFEPERDAVSVRALPVVEFSPFGLISGRATVGFAHVNLLDSRVPDFTGPVASLDLACTLRGATHISFRGARDMSYSYSVDQPYYVRNSLTLAVAQQVYGPWSLQGTAGGGQNEYRTLAGVSDSMAGRTDRDTQFGAGIGYHLGRTGTFSLNVSWLRRKSPLEEREYKGLRYGFSFAYGS